MPFQGILLKNTHFEQDKTSSDDIETMWVGGH